MDSNCSTLLRQRIARGDLPVAPEDQEELRRLVWAFVDELRSEDWPPERIIVAVKRLVREAGVSFPYRPAAADTNLTQSDKLLADIVGWCIQRYYDPNQAIG